MNNLDNMTIEEAHSLLVMRSGITERIIALGNLTEREIFIDGLSRDRSVFLTEDAFMKFAELFEKEIIYEDVDSCQEAYFYYTLHDKKYKIYCLLD